MDDDLGYVYFRAVVQGKLDGEQRLKFGDVEDSSREPSAVDEKVPSQSLIRHFCAGTNN